MTKIDIAQRVYNHTWKLDPIVRSLLDTDFYKFLMLQMIWDLYPDITVTFSLINRSRHVHLNEEIEEKALREQLDYARTLRFTKKEMIWLRGNSFYGKEQIFKPEFLSWLSTFRLPEYHLEKRGDGQYTLLFHGSWKEVMMWEVPALAILNELRSRAALKDFGRFGLDVLYARAKAKLWAKIERLKALPELNLSDFGTRRRHSFLWQRWCVDALKESLGPCLSGTSNVLLAMDTDLEAIGTNAHELPMVLAALAQNDKELIYAPYKVMEEWKRYYEGNLLVALPDTFSSTSFFENAPDWVANWTGFRIDSAPPLEAGERILGWWKRKGVNPQEKLLIFSDGLTIDQIETIYHNFKGRVRLGFGWGTNLTNDFLGCAPFEKKSPEPISLVCKIIEANGQPAVKLSDNLQKATGEAEAMARYLKVFAPKERVDRPVYV